MTKTRYLLALTITAIGFLPMEHTALRTSEYIPLVDYVCAAVGFLLAVYITETH